MAPSSGPPPPTRAEKVKLLSSAWLEQAKREGLVVAAKPRPARSQVSCGVSVDYLAKLAVSIRSHPLLPSTTQAIVDNIINAATAETRCRFLDIVPEEYIGYATAVVSHAWNGDFLDMLNAVVEDFNARWEAHRAYRNQRKTAAQVMAEEKEAEQAVAEAKRLQAKVDAVVNAASLRAAAGWTQDAQESQRTLSRSSTHRRVSRRASRLQVAQQSVPLSESGRATARHIGWDALHPANHSEGSTAPALAEGINPAVLRRRLAHQQTLQDQERERQRQSLDMGFEGLAATHSSAFAANHHGVEFVESTKVGDDDVPSAMQCPNKLHMGDVVGIAMATQHSSQHAPGAASHPKSFKQAAVKALLHRRSMGADTGLGLRVHVQVERDECVPEHPPTLLARSGTLARARQHSGVDGGWESPDAAVAPALTKSIYTRAKASTNLMKLLKPLDEEQEVLEAYTKAMKAASDKVIAIKNAQEQDWLREEKRKLLGYYVWIDVFALEQFTKCAAQPDLPVMARLINVVGRTIVIVDDDWNVLKRAWCLFEIWCTIKFKSTLVTISTAGANNALGLSPMSKGLQIPPVWSRSDSDEQGCSVDGQGCSEDTSGNARGQGLLPTDSELLGQDDTLTGLSPVPVIDLLQSKSTHSEDKMTILALWQDEVASPRTTITSLRQVTSILRTALQAARHRELEHNTLVRRVYNSLALCSRNWKGVLSSDWRDLDSAREALKCVAEEHLTKEFANARDVHAVSDSDVELELWQLIVFVAKNLAARHEEPFWITELTRFASLAHKSFATRFSASYVDQLLRQAGTFDDMKVLRSYVYGQCHTRIKSKRTDTGD